MIVRHGQLLLGLLASHYHVISALAPITIKGTKFYREDGHQFYIKGVAYGGGDSRMDPLLDVSQCQIDAGLMKTLGVNTIHVYNVDGSRSHDGCMQAFDSQGIYVWLELSTPLHSMKPLIPKPRWTAELFSNWSATVDAFSGYDNLLSFSVGNEVIGETNETTQAAAHIKAAVRDIKAFRDARGYRSIPVSYCAFDSIQYRQLTADYLACPSGGDTDSSIDFFGFNVYSWCGNNSYYTSGYDKLYESFQNINIPVAVAETGCVSRDQKNRDFAAVSAMFDPVFQALFSGAVVYEWAMGVNKYGIVSYSNTDFNTGFPKTLPDYNSLSAVYATANPAGTSINVYTPSNSPPACPTSDGEWQVDPSAELPSIVGLRLQTVTARATIASRPSSETTKTPGPTTKPDGPALSGGGLPVGTVAGIAVACVAVVLGLGIFAGICLFRKRKAKRSSRKPSGSDTSDADYRTELPVPTGPVIPRQEMDASQPEKQGSVEEYFAAKDALAYKEGEHRGAVGYGNMVHEMDGSGLPAEAVGGGVDDGPQKAGE